MAALLASLGTGAALLCNELIINGQTTHPQKACAVFLGWVV